MTYSELNTAFLGLALWFFVVAFVAIGIQMRRRARARRVGDEVAVSRRGRGLIWKYAATLIVLLVFTAVFDNLIVGLGIVAYDPAKISGIFIGVAPIEDFAYSIAAVLILPTLWGVLGHFPRRDKSQDER